MKQRASMAKIALRSGYRDPAAMTGAFREEFGVPPWVLRAGRRFLID